LQEFGSLQGGKAVIRNEGQNDFTSWSLVNGQAFHIVDLKTKIRFEQDGTIEDRTGLNICDRGYA
jgi:hypothetical protein